MFVWSFDCVYFVSLYFRWIDDSVQKERQQNAIHYLLKLYFETARRKKM